MNQFWTRLGVFIELTAAALLIVLVATVAAQIVFRYLLNDPLVGSEDMAKLAMVWMVFLSVPLVTRDHQHIRVDYFVDKMPPALRLWVDRGIDLIALAFLAVAVYQGVLLIPQVMGMKSVGLNVEIAWYSSALPVGLGLALLYGVARFFGRRDD
jgi:TRAP-type C4-dicarboxylate transport system permease small subunit